MAQCSFPRAGQRNKTILTLEKLEPGNIWHWCFKKKKSLKRLFNFDRKINYGCASALTSRRLSVNDYSSGARTSQSALRLQAVLSRRHHDDRQTDGQKNHRGRLSWLLHQAAKRERELLWRRDRNRHSHTVWLHNKLTPQGAYSWVVGRARSLRERFHFLSAASKSTTSARLYPLRN